jgi:DNA invertase Pin-like site-specific DNA recombinase
VQLANAEATLPRGVELVVDDRYRDVNVSGRTRADQRPGLAALFADLKTGVVTDVVVGYLSRFGRNTAELMTNVRRLDELGATLYVGGDSPMIVTPGTRGTAKMLLTILSAVDEMQADALEDGLKSANATAIADGVSITIPYGYRRSNGAGSPLEYDDDQRHGPAPADVVRRIYGWRELGLSCGAIAQRLNDEHVLTPTALRYERREREKPGAPLWKPNTVANLVAVHTYRGVIPRATQWSDTGKRKPIAWDLLPGRHEALVSERTWKAAQANGAPVVRNGGNGDAVLLGLVRCSSCSRTLKPSRHKSRISKRPGSTAGFRYMLTYDCPHKDCPHRARITRSLVDKLVLERLLEGHTVEREQRGDDELARELKGAEAELVAMSEDYDTFLSRAGVIPAERFARANAEYLQRLATAEGRVAVLKGRVTPDELDALRNFDAIELDGQRAVFARLLDAVVVLPAPGAGRSGVVAERVVLVPKGTAPFELSGTGRVVAARPWPL